VARPSKRTDGCARNRIEAVTRRNFPSQAYLPFEQEVELPPLPANAKYVYHPNECYDWGTIGWLLFESKIVKAARYKYFIIVNSSVRGPFLPPVVPVSRESPPTARLGDLRLPSGWFDVA
jgi:hypothetical protein